MVPGELVSDTCGGVSDRADGGSARLVRLYSTVGIGCTGSINACYRGLERLVSSWNYKREDGNVLGWSREEEAEEIGRSHRRPEDLGPKSRSDSHEELSTAGLGLISRDQARLPVIGVLVEVCDREAGRVTSVVKIFLPAGELGSPVQGRRNGGVTVERHCRAVLGEGSLKLSREESR